MATLISQRLLRIKDCLDHHKSLLSTYQQETKPVSRNRIEKELKVSQRRLNDIFHEIGSIGKGNITTVKYTCTWGKENSSFEETFVGLEISEVETLLNLRDFIFQGTHTIIDIQEKKASLTEYK